jgi:hypothetical protein
VLRSHYEHLRALLLVTMLAVIGLTVAVVILATTDNGGGSSTRVSSPAQVVSPAIAAASQTGATLDHRGLKATAGATTRSDGGPEEGTRGVIVTSAPTTRFDGGPEEGTRGLLAAPASRPANPSSYNGGHDEGSAGH